MTQQRRVISCVVAPLLAFIAFTLGGCSNEDAGLPVPKNSTTESPYAALLIRPTIPPIPNISMPISCSLVGCLLCDPIKTFKCLACQANYKLDKRSGYCGAVSEPQKTQFFVYRLSNGITGSNFLQNQDEFTRQTLSSLPSGGFLAYSAAGVLLKLHRDIIGNSVNCQRMGGVDRIERYLVDMHNPLSMLSGSSLVRQFGNFCNFHDGQCQDAHVRQAYLNSGFFVGCQAQSDVNYSYADATFYSFPGQCPQSSKQDKTRECINSSPGGKCSDPTGGAHCTYSIKSAGHVMLDNLVGIPTSFAQWCRDGGVEFNTATKAGSLFWANLENHTFNNNRVSQLKRWFSNKLVQGEALFDTLDGYRLPPPICESW